MEKYNYCHAKLVYINDSIIIQEIGICTLSAGARCGDVLKWLKLPHIAENDSALFKVV